MTSGFKTLKETIAFWVKYASTSTVSSFVEKSVKDKVKILFSVLRGKRMYYKGKNIDFYPIYPNST